MWTLPTAIETSSFWKTIKETDLFLMQKSSENEANSTMLKSVWATLQNVFDTKQPPYRIILRTYQGGAVDANIQMIAAAETLKEAEADWAWIEEMLLPELKQLEDKGDKVAFALLKFTSMVQNQDVETDEKSSDAKFRAAARSWRQLFRMDDTERLVNFIELKDVEELSKEKSKRGMISDSIRIVTRNKTEHFFSNLFQRDETFELLEYLTNLALQRLLKATSTDPAPGLSLKHAKSLTDMLTSPAAILGLEKGGDVSRPLKQSFELQRRNMKFQWLFNLPNAESIIEEISVTCSVSGTNTNFQGRLYLSDTFLCFLSAAKYQCQLALPFFAIMRVERINSQTSTVAITARHQLKLLFQFLGDRTIADKFCASLKDRLQAHVGAMKRLKSFLSTCQSEDLLSGRDVQVGGLGVKYGYVDSKKAVEKSKLRYWISYFREYGRNLTLVRLPTFIKLVRIGLPNTLRGEIWELCSGAVYKRSLPEYSGYQTAEGINQLRRVLYAFSYHEPEIGYCQAMNIVVSVLLIYLTEEQAFWILTVLCAQMLPGYYTVNMVGAVIDNHVFESLVHRFMPVLGDHIKRYDIQLSVACLPWFLSLFINSLPLPYSLRILDCFFMEGAKVLFQVGLAILKINGDAILNIKDDGELMNILKEYFSNLDDIFQEEGQNARPTTKFNQLMLTAYREFQNVTNDMIVDLRKTHQLKVIQNMDLYAKRSVVRNLTFTSKFTKDELLFLCDQFYTAQFYDTKSAKLHPDRLDFSQFKRLVSKVAVWANTEADQDNQLARNGNDSSGKSIVGSDFIDRLFSKVFDINGDGLVDLQDIVRGLAKLIHSGSDAWIGIIFSTHDGDGDGELNREETIHVSETLLFLTRQLEGDKHLGSVSTFLNRSFTSGETDSAATSPASGAPELNTASTGVPTTDAEDHSNPPGAHAFSLKQSTMEAVIADDEFLKHLFAEVLPSQFKLYDTNTSVKQKVMAPSMHEISESLWSGGLKWATDRITTGKRIPSDTSTSSVAVPGAIVAAPVESDMIASDPPDVITEAVKHVDVSDEDTDYDRALLDEVDSLLREAELTDGDTSGIDTILT
ncbi:hypothetical protein BSLG_008430 [Batrachochytrium salamandrivorans]|nr:hypothetical protein BSLG_008430 [Batrachochytrium salamandrivorans]